MAVNLAALAAAAAALALPSTDHLALRGPDWAGFKADYVTGDGRVLDLEAGGISHTEGQGWGMLLAEADGDREGFDRLWRWTDSHLARPDVRLFSWKYDPATAGGVADRNDATDGDIFLAWALMRAGARWTDPAYAKSSAEIRRAIATRLIARAGGRTLLLPGLDGFSTPDHLVYNPSYFVLPALQAFAAAEPNGPWRKLIADGLVWADTLRLGAQHLPPDWVDIAPDGTPSPAKEHPNRFGFDAIRAPLYLAWGGQARHPEVVAVSRFWSGAVKAGRWPPAWIDLSTGAVAPYAVSPGAARIVTLLVPDRAPPAAAPAPPQTYYSAVLQRLTALAEAEVAGHRAGS